MIEDTRRTMLSMINDYKHHINADNEKHRIPDSAEPVLLDETSGWVRSEKNVLSGFFSMYQPEVIYIEGEDYPYRMWCMGWAYNLLNEPETLEDGSLYPGMPGGDAIFTARSKNMEEWEVYSRTDNGTGEVYWDRQQKVTDWVPVITCENIWYDDFHVGDPSVIYSDGTYYMAYSAMGTDKPNPEEEFPWSDNAACIMGAVSHDGLHWEKSAEPLLIWEQEYGFDETKYKDTYYGGYQRPSIMYENGRWKMWYDYSAGKENGVSIGYAENTGDFLNPGAWVRFTGDTSPILSHWVDIDVVKIGHIYYAYGDPFTTWYGIKDDRITDCGTGWSLRQIMEAQSYDGIHWIPTGYFRPDNGYPANQIPQVFLDHKNGRVCIFYATQRGLQADGEYCWRWDNFRYLYKNIRDFAC